MRAGSLILLLLLCDCGYHAGTISGGEGRSIAVPVFRNETFRRNLERDLTRAVRREIQDRTGFTLVRERSNPDLVLEGDLVNVTESVLSEHTRARIRVSSVTLNARITVTDAATGKKLVNNRNIVVRKTFAPAVGESLRTAENEAMRQMAEKVVYTLESGW